MLHSLETSADGTYVYLSVHILLKTVAPMEIWAEVWRSGLRVGQPTKDKRCFVHGRYILCLTGEDAAPSPVAKGGCYNPAGRLGTTGEASQKLGSWARQ